jgi:branched-chain amino acid transport system substrate-binding protein
MRRRDMLTIAAGSLAVPWIAKAATPGVTAKEIKIGNTMPYSGPASSYASIGKAQSAFFRMLNDSGGIAGRRITFISLDDGYSPPRTVEQARRLLEQEEVAFLFSTLGTPTNAAIQRYCNERKTPQLFVVAGSEKMANYKNFPWTIGWQPGFRTEGQIYGKHVLQNRPDAKIGVLIQSDDVGRDFLAGVRDALGEQHAKMLVKVATYEVTDPAIDSQLVSLQSAGADTLINGAVAKFAAQAIRKMAGMNWKPLHLLTNISVSVGAVMIPAGAENGTGIVSAVFIKDSTDPLWADGPGIPEWRAFMTQYMPGADQADDYYISGYSRCLTLMQTLKQCGDDFSRENVMRQATNLHNLQVPTLLPGIVLNTSPTNYHPIRQMQLQRWSGKNWELFGDVISAEV